MDYSRHDVNEIYHGSPATACGCQARCKALNNCYVPTHIGTKNWFLRDKAATEARKHGPEEFYSRPEECGTSASPAGACSSRKHGLSLALACYTPAAPDPYHPGLQSVNKAASASLLKPRAVMLQKTTQAETAVYSDLCGCSCVVRSPDRDSRAGVGIHNPVAWSLLGDDSGFLAVSFPLFPW